jgi:hypothetical protein
MKPNELLDKYKLYIHSAVKKGPMNYFDSDSLVAYYQSPLGLLFLVKGMHAYFLCGIDDFPRYHYDGRVTLQRLTTKDEVSRGVQIIEQHGTILDAGLFDKFVLQIGAEAI